MSRKNGRHDDSQTSAEASSESAFSSSHSLFGHAKRSRRNSLGLSASLRSSVTKVYVIDGEEFVHVPLANADFLSTAKLGKGGQSTVFAGVIDFSMEGGDSVRRRVALKEVKGKNTHASFLQKKAGEALFITMHEQVTHEHVSSTQHNIIKLLGYVESDGDVFAVFPYCGLFLSKLITLPGEEASVSPMQTLLESDPKAFFAVVLHVLSDQLHSLQHLESKGMVNRDVKSDNITYYDGHWCATDMDDVAVIGSQPSFAGTPYFVHPYVYVEGSTYNTQPGNAVYGLGQVLSLLLGNKLTEYKNEFECRASKCELYEAALKKMQEERASAGEPFSYPSLREALSDVIGKMGTVFDQLQKIVDYMTHPLPERQATVAEVISVVEAMTTELKASSDFQGIQSRVDEFYASMESFGPYFREEVTSPLHRSLSASSGFFSASARSEDTLQLDSGSVGYDDRGDVSDASDDGQSAMPFKSGRF